MGVEGIIALLSLLLAAFMAGYKIGRDSNKTQK